mmetsp:Transcript_86547/g.240881  ORF Transcript_86547/g.240881 Transcript_86547/m.240881 type:complete len:83 (+) Transcript_86547:632-880(+)
MNGSEMQSDAEAIKAFATEETWATALVTVAAQTLSTSPQTSVAVQMLLPNDIQFVIMLVRSLAQEASLSPGSAQSAAACAMS